MAAARRTSPPPIGCVCRSFDRVHLPLVVLLTPRPHDFQPRLNLRVKEERRRVEKRWSGAFASNTNPPKESKESGDTGQGPPLLTILAGAFVFFLFSWLILSLVKWVVALIFG